MSKGLGKRERQILCKMYGDWRSVYLDDFERGIRQSGVSKKTTFYALERLIKKGLVTKHRREIDGKQTIFYNLTDEGKNISAELFKEVFTYVWDTLGFGGGSGSYATVAKRILRKMKETLEEAMTQPAPQENTETEIETEIEEELPDKDIVLLDFYADWCEPCKLLSPFIDAWKEEFREQVTFKKINIEVDRKQANKYKVMSVPTVIIEKNGIILKRFTGFSHEIQSGIDKALNKALKRKSTTSE